MNMIKHRDKLLTPQDLGLWKGDIVTAIPSAERPPELHWTGARLTRELLSQMVGFFRYIYDHWSSEAQVRLAYNDTTKSWAAICLPQEVGTGMTSNELDCTSKKMRALRERARELLSRGYYECGSCHSHCTSGAFQSGTDESDELENMGLHITMGTITSPKIDIHGRVTFRGVQYPIHWDEWIEDWPESLDPRIDKFWLVPEERLSFPEEWLDFCFDRKELARRRPRRPHTGVTSHQRQFTGHSQQSWEGDAYGYGFAGGRPPSSSAHRGSQAGNTSRSTTTNWASPFQNGHENRIEGIKMNDRNQFCDFLAKHRRSFWRAPFPETTIGDMELSFLLQLVIDDTTWADIIAELAILSEKAFSSPIMESLESTVIQPYVGLRREMSKLMDDAFLDYDQASEIARLAGLFPSGWSIRSRGNRLPDS